MSILYKTTHLEDFFFWACGLGLRTALYNNVSGDPLYAINRRSGFCESPDIIAVLVSADDHGEGGIILPDSLIENTLEVTLSQRRTLQVLVCSNLLGNDQGLVIRNRLHSLLPQALKCSRVLAEIELGANQDDGN